MLKNGKFFISITQAGVGIHLRLYSITNGLLLPIRSTLKALQQVEGNILAIFGR